DAFVTGATGSTNFPTANAVKGVFAGGGDAFVAELNPSGSGLVYGTYLGGSGSDTGQALALDALGNAFVPGSTPPTHFPTAAPLQAAGGGGADAFVAKVPFVSSPLVYTETVATAVLTLRRSGPNLQLLRDGQLIVSRPLAGVTGVTIQGPTLY